MFYFGCILLLAGVAVATLSFPLAAVPGYEFAISMAVAVVPVVAVHTIVCRPRQQSITNLSHTLLMNLGLLALPLLISSLNALRVGGCGLLSGLGFYLLLPGVSVVFATAVAIFLHNHTRRRWLAVVLFFLLLLLSVTFTLLRTVYGVPLYAFNAFFGYFPGPIYDPALAIDARLVLYRLFVLGLALWWLLLDWQSIFTWRTRRAAGFWFLTLLLAGLFLSESHLGFYTSRDYLRRSLGSKLAGEGFQLFYDRRLSSQDFNPDEFKSDCQYWFDTIRRELQLEDNKQPITIYVYGDVASKKRLTGAGKTLIGDPINREVHMLPAAFPNTILKHELTHVLAGAFGIARLGLARTPGLMEGLAVALEGWQGKFSTHQWAKAVMERERPPDVKEVMQGLKFYQFPMKQSYSVAGSFVEFLLQRYGLDRFKEVYRTGRFQRVYQLEIHELISQWRSWLDDVVLSAGDREEMQPVLARKAIFQRRCPHETASLRAVGYRATVSGDFERARGCFVKSYALSGGAAADLYGLTYVYQENPSWQGSLESYLLARTLVKRKTHNNVAWRLLGDLFLHHDQSLLALASYQRVPMAKLSRDQRLVIRMLELGMPTQARTFLQKRSTSERLKLVTEWLEDGHGFVEMLWWQSVTQLKVDKGEADKLATVVAQLDNDQRFARLPKALHAKRQRLLGEYFYRQGDVERAAIYFAAAGEEPAAKIWRQRVVAEITGL